jgi:hypothetical protein
MDVLERGDQVGTSLRGEVAKKLRQDWVCPLGAGFAGSLAHVLSEGGNGAATVGLIN